jgi:hypothetical protein
MTPSISIPIDSENEDLDFYIELLKYIKNHNDEKERIWKENFKKKKKKKTLVEILQEIEDEIQEELERIDDSNIEIENLKLKKQEIENLVHTP